jgi:hypothetical protein
VSVEEEVVSRLVRRLETLGIPYMIAGSFASSHHGLPRATNDADIVVDPSPEALDALLAALAADGYYADARTAREALQARRLFTILSKLEWARKAGGSERQLADALGVLQVCGDRLDRAYVEKWAAALGVGDLWRDLLATVRSSGRP